MKSSSIELLVVIVEVLDSLLVLHVAIVSVVYLFSGFIIRRQVVLL